MIDNPRPDSGRIPPSSDILLCNAKTALMYEELRAAIDGGHESMTHADALAEIAAIRAENETLRAGYDAARLEIESLQARIKTMAEEHADELMVAHLDGRMLAGQSAAAMHGEHAELRRLSDCCPELNLSNYGPDDVDDLNGWAIEVSQCIDRALASAAAPAVAAIVFEHEDGRYAVNPDTTGDPAWHRLGPVDISALAASAQSGLTDAYAGAREDLSIWKRRALEAERDLRSEKQTTSRLVGELNAANGPAYMCEPAASPAPTRAFLERTLAAMEGVIDVADRQTDEFEALRSCVIDLTVLLFSKSAPARDYPPLPMQFACSGVFPVYSADQMRAFADATHAIRVASHGQAPAQAAPAYKDSTPELHIGDSAFESWYSSYKPTHKGDKQRARDAYAAGMGDPLVMAAPTTQPAPPQEAQEPMAWHEQARAIREGNEIAASDKYFSARPQIVSADRRKVFRAGFERGWDAARAAQEVKSHDN